jgi:SAM-dependent methyltransferase
MEIPGEDKDQEARLHAYFKNRGIDSAYYLSFQLPAWLKDELPSDKSSRILDIGCGFGQMLLRLRDAGYTNITGVDIGSESVDFCRSQGLNVEKITSIDAFADSHRGQYDLILMSHVLEHIPKEQTISTLSSIRSMLAEKGSFIVMVPNAQSATGVYWMYEDFTHHLLFTAGSLRYALLSAGFEQIEFPDPRCLKGLSPLGKIKRRLFHRLFEWKVNFWNRATASSFHNPSPRIFSFEIKARAR